MPVYPILWISLNIAPLVTDGLYARQIGDIQCNVERLKTVSALGKAQSAVKKLAESAKYSILLDFDLILVGLTPQQLLLPALPWILHPQELRLLPPLFWPDRPHQRRQGTRLEQVSKTHCLPSPTSPECIILLEISLRKWYKHCCGRHQWCPHGGSWSGRGLQMISL